MKTLIIAEKPSVCRDIASALGKIKKNGDWYENDQYIVSASVGHIVELKMPEDIDKSLAYWKMESLPIIPKKFDLKPIKTSESQFKVLKKLMGRKDVETIVNGCDAGREGELIFAYIYQLARCKKPVQRLWMQSMTPQAIREAFNNLRDGVEMEPLQQAARCRSEADWLIGINGTRAITKRMYGSRAGNVASVGRVQTPTLTLVYERDQKIHNFKPQDYWQIVANFQVHAGEYEGIFQRPDFKKSKPRNEHDRIDRIWDKSVAEGILKEVQAEKTAQVSEEKKRSKQAPPLFYDLTSLQREANGRYGLPAGKTLRLAQALYEKHKMITYPRTDSRVLPEDYVNTCKDVLQTLSGDLGKHGKKALEQGWVKPSKRLFNNAKVSDHFAIIPTGESKKLTEDEAKIFDMIARRFVAAFFPPAEYDLTIRQSMVGEHRFKTEGKVLAIPGWLVVYGKDKSLGKGELPALSEQDGNPAEAKINSSELKEAQTKPPPHYTEATLLTAMETAGRFVDDEELAEAMKDNGLGTPATRAQIIEHLLKQKYMDREGRDLIATTKAEQLIEFLNVVHTEALTSPSMTGEWEHKLHKIEQKQLSRDAFMQGIIDLTNKVVEHVKGFDEKDEDAEVTAIISPTDNKPMLKNFRSYKSQDGEIVIYQTVGQRKLSAEEVEVLIKERRIGPLDGFRSKFGKPFSAILELDEKNKVKFVFGNNNGGGEDQGSSEPLDLSQLTVIGNCPKCSDSVYEAPSHYSCGKFIDGSKGCDFRISRTMLGKALPAEEIKNLLENKKTSLIEGFRSNRTKRLFNAFLILKDKGGIGFEFPPRAPKKKAEPKAKKSKAAS